jgi:hypothetical protein
LVAERTTGLKRPACGEPAGLKSALEVQVFLADGELVALCTAITRPGWRSEPRSRRTAGSGARCAVIEDPPGRCAAGSPPRSMT